MRGGAAGSRGRGAPRVRPGGEAALGIVVRGGEAGEARARVVRPRLSTLLALERPRAPLRYSRPRLRRKVRVRLRHDPA